MAARDWLHRDDRLVRRPQDPGDVLPKDRPALQAEEGDDPLGAHRRDDRTAGHLQAEGAQQFEADRWKVRGNPIQR